MINLNLREWKPIIYNKSKVPGWLSHVSPIDIYAISFGAWVWCRDTLDPDDLRFASAERKAAAAETVRHETIHFQQQLELLFVFQWLLYGLFWLAGLIRYRDGAKAYYESPFEREAYANDKDEDYLHNRRRYAWVKYICNHKA